MADRYEKVAGLISHIRNARFGEMVRYSEELIESEDWRDFKSPVGTKFHFERCEYDYFLAAMEIDAKTLRHAYAQAASQEKWLRLADITGRGAEVKNGDRRSRDEVSNHYSDEPSGAGARIRAWGDEGTTVVTEDMARIARDKRRREALKAGLGMKRAARNVRDEHVFRARAAKRGDLAAVIVDKLLADPDLAHTVFKGLNSWQLKKRRSEG